MMCDMKGMVWYVVICVVVVYCDIFCDEESCTLTSTSSLHFLTMCRPPDGAPTSQHQEEHPEKMVCYVWCVL